MRRNNVKMERQNSSGLATYDPLSSECSASRRKRRNNVQMKRQNSSGLASYDPLCSECSASRRRPAAASVVLRVANDECSASRRKRRV